VDRIKAAKHENCKFLKSRKSWQCCACLEGVWCGGNAKVT